MFRYGITDRTQISGASADGPLPPVYSYALLGDFDEDLSAEEEEVVANICEQMSGGRSRLKRRTRPGRYRHVDEVIAAEIERCFPDANLVRIHDMAASNAITSLELFQRLGQREGVSVRASDVQEVVHIVKVAGDRWKVVFDASGQALQFVGGRFVIDAPKPDRQRFPMNRALRQLLRLIVLPRARARLRTGDRKNIDAISLFHPKALAGTQKDRRFTLGHDDLFDPQPGSYELVRIMGVFSVLPDSAVAQAVSAVSPCVVQGGLLVIGVNNGRETTIFRKNDGGFEIVRDIGTGFDRSAVVQNVRG